MTTTHRGEAIILVKQDAARVFGREVPASYTARPWTCEPYDSEAECIAAAKDAIDRERRPEIMGVYRVPGIVPYVARLAFGPWAILTDSLRLTGQTILPPVGAERQADVLLATARQANYDAWPDNLACRRDLTVLPTDANCLP